MDEHSGLEAIAQLAADDADRQLSERIRTHGKKERRGRITRRILRWTFFICAVVLGLMIYLQPEHPVFLNYVLPVTVLIEILSGGMLLFTGGLYPDRMAPTVTRQEKATLDNRLARHETALAEETGVAVTPDEADNTPLADDTESADEFQFEGLPQPGSKSAVSRHIESRKRYPRTASGAVAAIVIYAIWEIISDAVLP